MTDTVEAVFAGADDSGTCEGCADAMDGNPYDLADCPEPGSFECMSRCRHIIQLTQEPPDDIQTMEWSSTNGFTVSDEAAATDDYYGGTKFDDQGHEVPDDEELDVEVPVDAEGAPDISDLELADVLDLGDSDALDSYVDDNGLADLKDQASAGFSDSSKAYYLAEALQKREPGAGWKVQFDGQWYVTNNDTRIQE